MRPHACLMCSLSMKHPERAGPTVTSVSFNQRFMQIHVAQPGATAVISGLWDGPHGSGFSLRGLTAGDRWDGLDVAWHIVGPRSTGAGEPLVAGTWDATVRFYRTGTIDLTVTLT